MQVTCNEIRYITHASMELSVSMQKHSFCCVKISFLSHVGLFSRERNKLENVACVLAKNVACYILISCVQLFYNITSTDLLFSKHLDDTQRNEHFQFDTFLNYSML